MKDSVEYDPGSSFNYFYRHSIHVVTLTEEIRRLDKPQFSLKRKANIIQLCVTMFSTI